MKTIHQAMLVSVLLTIVLACAALAPEPTATPVPTPTSLPTSTSTPQPTPAPTGTPIPQTEAPSPLVLPTPSGKPLTEWEGIPVMPNALAGEGDSKGYSFIIKASPDEIRTYYEQALPKLGWNMLASGQGSTSAILLIFMKDSNTVSVSIIPQPDGVVYVLLVK